MPGTPLRPRILITRTRDQASELCAALEALGAETIQIPTIEIAPPASWQPLDAALAEIHSFDWLLFTSANAVESFARRRVSIAPDPSSLKDRPAPRVAVIGPATARAVQAAGLPVDLIPPQFVAESLAESLLPFAHRDNGQPSRMLLLRAEIARDILPETLTAAGAAVTIVPVYRNLIPPTSIAALHALFTGPNPPAAVTFTSSSTATNLLALLEAARLTLPPTIIRASIGPVTSETLRQHNLPPHLESVEPTIPSLVAALAHHFRLAE